MKSIKQAEQIKEGTEYEIRVNGATIYQGIAESDTDATETLKAYWLRYRNRIADNLKFEVVAL
jgi:hypothetical protein